MINLSSFRFFQFPFARRSSLLPMMGLFSVMGLGASLLLSDIAHAQTPAEMSLYTNIARQIERQRMQDYAEVKQLMGGSVPENVCTQGNLTPQVRKVCDRFDSTSREIITRNGMSITKFNDITRYCQQSPKPKECPR